MKIKSDFVTNSSSTCFIIINKSDKKKSLVDFVKENPQLIEEYIQEYEWNKDNPDYCQENMIESAKRQNFHFDPHEALECVFGDESGTLIGQVFDYILRDGGSSENFTWYFKKYYR